MNHILINNNERYKIPSYILKIQRKLLLNKHHKVGFIHITKTGGTDFKDKNINKEVYFGDYHYENSLFYKNFLPCFAIIREPIERFKSTFFYNICGSSKYGKKEYCKKYDDINDFIDDCINDDCFLNNFENGWQFRQQYKWLTGNKSNTFVLKYNNNNNCCNIVAFLKKEFNIDYTYTTSNIKINMTYYNHNIISIINEKNNNFLRDFYKEDYYIYEKLIELNCVYARFSDICI